MMRVPLYLLLTMFLVDVRSEESSESNVCEAPGLWGVLLEDWATSAAEPPGRQGRVMSLPPTSGYYVTERIDGPLVPPPPPQRPSGPYGTHTGAGPQSSHEPHYQQPTYSQYDEWRATPPPPPGASKIVNRPPNPYKDKFKPNYGPTPAHNPHIPVSPSQSGLVDRVDAPPKQVSETDLYLLTAIEKLVYRVDLMEKRLRRAEETMHYLVAGKDPKPEPCPQQWRRVGRACYLVSSEPYDWKAASLRCRKHSAHLLELSDHHQRRALYSTLLADRELKGNDFWTGGLNPGLLWIWAHSARPLADNTTAANSTVGTAGTAGTVLGDGRCLALVHDPALATYVYRGHDCALRHRFICEATEDKMRLSNEIERVARQLKDISSVTRKAKLLWDPDRI